MDDDYLTEERKRLRELLAEAIGDRERYRAALARISSANSGVWGDIARDALYPKQDRQAVPQTTTLDEGHLHERGAQ